MPVVTILKWFCYNVPGTRGNCNVKLFLTSNERDDLHSVLFPLNRLSRISSERFSTMSEVFGSVERL